MSYFIALYNIDDSSFTLILRQYNKFGINVYDDNNNLLKNIDSINITSPILVNSSEQFPPLISENTNGNYTINTQTLASLCSDFEANQNNYKFTIEYKTQPEGITFFYANILNGIGLTNKTFKINDEFYFDIITHDTSQSLAKFFYNSKPGSYGGNSYNYLNYYDSSKKLLRQIYPIRISKNLDYSTIVWENDPNKKYKLRLDNKSQLEEDVFIFITDYMSEDENLGNNIYIHWNNQAISDLVVSNICFPANTPIITDQGIIFIDKLDSNLNTIDEKRIVTVTKTISNEDYLVFFEKNSLDENVPDKDTIISSNHKIFHNKNMIPAKNFLDKQENIYRIKYDGQLLYNILMEEHNLITVNNMLVETLDPKNIVAHIYQKNISVEQKNKEINDLTIAYMSNNRNRLINLMLKR